MTARDAACARLPIVESEGLPTLRSGRRYALLTWLSPYPSSVGRGREDTCGGSRRCFVPVMLSHH